MKIQLVIDTTHLYEAFIVATLAWFGTLALYNLTATYVNCSSILFYLVHAFHILIEVPIYLFVRLIIKLLEFVCGNHRTLRHKRRHATSYEEWLVHSKKLDELTHRLTWAYNLTDEIAKHYSWSYLEELMEDLRLAREEQDAPIAIALLQLCLRKNVGGIFSSELYSYLHTGEPKQIIKDFVEEVVQTLQWMTEKVKSSGDEEEQRLAKELLERSLSTYGTMALCFSGGGMMGNYHMGAVQAYKKAGILPKIMSGSSMGSIIAAFTCTRTDEEFERDCKPEVLRPRLYGMGSPWSERIELLIKTGAMWDRDDWLEGAKWFTCGEMTFLEAYRKTGRTLNISLSTTCAASPPVLLNHITAPNVCIYSAIVCSASAPCFLPPGYLIIKKPDGAKEVLKEEYFDGSVEQDIPKEAMQEQLNCQFFIVVQAEPQLLPFQFHPNGSPGNPAHDCLSKRGSFLSGLELYIKMDMKNRLRFLRDFGIHRGGLANVFTQDLHGDINICVPCEVQDFLKVIDQPSVADLHRYHQGGNYMAYGSVAMIKLHAKISDAIDECCKSLKLADSLGEENEVERLVRPSLFGGSVDSKSVLVRHARKRESLVVFHQRRNSAELLAFEEDEEQERSPSTNTNVSIQSNIPGVVKQEEDEKKSEEYMHHFKEVKVMERSCSIDLDSVDEEAFVRNATSSAIDILNESIATDYSFSNTTNMISDIPSNIRDVVKQEEDENKSEEPMHCLKKVKAWERSCSIGLDSIDEVAFIQNATSTTVDVNESSGTDSSLGGPTNMNAVIPLNIVAVVEREEEEKTSVEPIPRWKEVQVLEQARRSSIASIEYDA